MEKEPEGEGLSPFKDFVDAVLTGRKPSASGEDGLEVMKMIDGLYESARKSRDVKIG